MIDKVHKYGMIKIKKSKVIKMRKDYLFKLNYYAHILMLGHSKAMQWRKCKYVQRNGDEVLKTFKVIAESHKCKYSLIFGSLLGAYREHDYIKHDDDIDVVMFDYDITLDLVKDLMEKGFRFLHAAVENHYNGYHVAFEYLNVKFDIYSITTKDGESSVFIPDAWKGDFCLSGSLGKFIVKRLILPTDEFGHMDFRGLGIMVVKEAEEVLRRTYGDNFMTPIKGYHSSRENKYVIKEPCEKCFAYLYHYVTFEELKLKGLI